MIQSNEAFDVSKFDFLKDSLLVNCNMKYYDLLLKLFPNYAHVECISVPSNFIVKQDISSLTQKTALTAYSSYVVISNKLFDLHLTEEILSTMILEFRRRYFKTRKKKFPKYNMDNFLEIANNFLDTGTEEEDSDVTLSTLFSAIGSQKFATVYCNMLKDIPHPVLQKSVITVFNKMFKNETLFYVQMNKRIGKRFIQNYNETLSKWNDLSKKEQYNDPLHFINFCLELWK